MIEISVKIIRHGRLIIIEGLETSVTFYPNDKGRTFDALVDKLRDLGSVQSQEETHNLDVQLTNIYKEYYEQRENKIVSDAEHLVLLAASEIKEQFKD